jgi:hypothetical protein
MRSRLLHRRCWISLPQAQVLLNCKLSAKVALFAELSSCYANICYYWCKKMEKVRSPRSLSIFSKFTSLSPFIIKKRKKAEHL